MGGANVSEAELNYYNEMITTLANEANTDTLIETAGAESKGASTQAGVSVLMIGLGFVLFLVPGGQGIGLALVGAGATGLGTTDWGSITPGTSGTTGGGVTEPNASPPDVSYIAGGAGSSWG
jgi:hypothetical protein